MKRRSLILSILALANVTYAVTGEFTNSAEFRVRHTANIQDDRSVTEQNNETHTDHRLMWNIDYRSGEKFSGHLGLIHHSRWGADNNAGSTFSADEKSGTPNETLNVLIVNKAYASWMISDDTMMKLGRMPINIADGRVLGARNYGNEPQSYSAFYFGHDTEFANIGLYGLKLNDRDEVTTSGSQDPEKNMYLFNFDFKSLPDFLKLANIHIIKISDNESSGGASGATTADNQIRYGITLGGDAAGVDYNLTYAAINGDSGTSTKTDYASSMLDFTLGYTAAGFLNSRFYANYHTDTGDKDSTDDKNETYDPLFYAKHPNAGRMDVLAWGNLTDTNINWTFTAGGADFGIHYHIFSATEKEATTANKYYDGSQVLLSGGDVDKTDLGTEIDLVASRKYSENFKISAMLSQFSFGKRVSDTTEIKDLQKLTIEGTWNF